MGVGWLDKAEKTNLMDESRMRICTYIHIGTYKQTDTRWNEGKTKKIEKRNCRKGFISFRKKKKLEQF